MKNWYSYGYSVLIEEKEVYFLLPETELCRLVDFIGSWKMRKIIHNRININNNAKYYAEKDKKCEHSS